MRPGIDVSGLLLGTEGVPKCEATLTGHEFVVPLEEEQERDRYAGGLFTLLVIAFPQRAKTEHAGDNARLAGQQRNAESRAHRHAPIAEWAIGPLRIGGQIVEERLPFGNCLRGDPAHGPDPSLGQGGETIALSASEHLGPLLLLLSVIRSPCPGASRATTPYSPCLTSFLAKPRTFGTRLCWAPP